MRDNKPDSEEKRAAELEPFCEAEATPTSNRPLAPGREAGRCDEPTEVSPDVFVAPPDPAADPPAQLRLPDALITSNTEVTQSCAANLPDEGNIGEPNSITIPSGQVEEEVFFQDLGLSISELQRLSSRTDLQQIVDNEMSIEQIKVFTDLSTVDSTALFNAVQAAQEVAQTGAINLALGQLNCIFGNENIYVSCDPAFQGTYTDTLVTSDYPVIQIAENTVTSTISRADANDKAAREKLQELDCEYGNTEQVVSCDDPALVALNGNFYLTREFIIENPNLDLRVSGVGRKLVSQVIIPAGTFTAGSIDAANALALASGQQQLDCFYPSSAVTKYCFDESEVVGEWAASEQLDRTEAQDGLGGEAVDIYVLDQYTGFGSLNEVSGKSVNIPEGYFTSDTSKEDADSLSENQSLALLSCFWTNPEFSCECDEGFDEDLTPIPASTVPAGTIQDFGGPVTPIDLAVYCQSQLACVFCNEEILPSCLPDGYEDKPEAHVGGNVNNPLILPVVESLYNDPDLDWSLDATSGVAAKTFCFPDKDTTDSLADAAASIPARPTTGDNSAGCRYTNDRQVVGCVQDNGLDGWKFTEAEGIGLSPESSTTQVIAAGVIVVTDIETEEANLAGGTNYTPVEYANLLARNLGISFLNCFFVNRQIILRCFDNANDATVNDLPAPALIGAAPNEILYYGDGKMASTTGNRFEVWEDAPGSVTNAVEVAAESYISYTSRADAEALAGASALAVLDCYFANPTTYVYCGARVEDLGTAATFEFSAALTLPSVTSLTVGDGKIGTDNIVGGFKFNDPTPMANASQTSLDVFGDYTTGRPEDLPERSPIKVSLQEVVVNPSPGGTPGDYRDTVHPDSTGAPGSVVVVVAGSFISRTSYFGASSQAVSTGIGRLNCFVKNDPTSTSCIRHDPWFEEDPNPDFPPILRPADIFFSESVTDVSLEADVISSTTSKFEANTQAWAMIFGLLNCVYDNYEQQKLCIWNEDAYGPTVDWAEENPAIIALGEVKSSESSEAAGAIAVNLARAKSDCVARQGGGDASCGWRASSTGNEMDPREVCFEAALVHLDSTGSTEVLSVMPTLDTDPGDANFGLPLDNDPKPTISLDDDKVYGVFLYFRSSPTPRARIVVIEKTSAPGVVPEVFDTPPANFLDTNERFSKTGEITIEDDVVSTTGSLCGPETLATADEDNDCKAFKLVDVKPAYLPANNDPQAPNTLRTWVSTGVVNDVSLTAPDDYYDIAATTYFWIKVDFVAGEEAMVVDEVSVVTGPNSNSFTNTTWAIGDPRPTTFYIPQGFVSVNAGVFSVQNFACGSISISEHITRIQRSVGNTTLVQKQITYVRF